MLLSKEGAPETLSDWQRGRGREVGTTVTAELDSDLVRSLGFLPLFESAAELRAAMH
jgi:hypothetical protein